MYKHYYLHERSIDLLNCFLCFIFLFNFLKISMKILKTSKLAYNKYRKFEVSVHYNIYK